MGELTTRGLSVKRGERVVLEDVSVTFAPGSVTALIGPNGAGKSTLLRALTGVLPAASGEILWQGMPLRDPVERARTLAWVPERASIPFSYEVLYTVVLGRFPWHRGHPGKNDYARAREALEWLGIEAFAHREITELSAGELQKTMIARALASDAPVILLDEPCANLDIEASLALAELFRVLSRSGKTIVFTVHDVALADRFADRIVCLAQGKVAKAGATREVLTAELAKAVFRVALRELCAEGTKRHLVFERLEDL